MQSLKPAGALLFFVVLTAHCICIYYGLGEARIISKLLLVPVLLFTLHLSSTNISPWVKASLRCCFVGDFFLARDSELFFILGMLAFILAHVFNSIYFYKLQHKHTCRMREAVIVAAVLMLLSATVFTVLNNYLGGLRIPILVYMVVISVMAILAASTTGNSAVRSIAMRRFIPGAGLFVLSDALLALNKFMIHDPHLNIPVMAAYGGALYLLADGFALATNNDGTPGLNTAL